ncbi:hypothetical protein AKO1_003942 [Acrasis kona]|uniref:Uncharacterized protein n=1 Tax=Acrasis kona TaxID=1008807 RepID=A0AAW2ZLR8_9EUKA
MWAISHIIMLNILVSFKRRIPNETLAPALILKGVTQQQYHVEAQERLLTNKVGAHPKKDLNYARKRNNKEWRSLEQDFNHKKRSKMPLPLTNMEVFILIPCAPLNNINHLTFSMFSLLMML